ncbi:hypothetical protein ACFYKX_25490 [Cytobacillus sp. FJAT-54145]|uniref:Uncharacterized protein n=1 Tax=Cytobacillus spartinae TaxID=3299023 RepID=A0ABW6KI50_9BACI
MRESLATFMKIASCVIAVSAFIFYVSYKLLEDESDKYITHLEDSETEILRNLP